MKHKIIKGHKRSCTALKNTMEPKGTWRHWDTSWGVYEKTTFGRKNSPTYSGSYQWLIFGCNDPDCNAKLAVFLNDILAKCENK